MTHILEFGNVLIKAPCYLGYLWMADKFCKKYLGTPQKNKWLFVIFGFSGWLLLNIANRRHPIPYIFLVMLGHMFFMGLVLLLFGEHREKSILAASSLMTVITLAGNFCESFLSCLALFFRHTVNRVQEPFLDEWEVILINSLGFCLVILVVYGMSKCFSSVFYGKPRKWYIILAIPLLAITAVIDVVNWGASNGILVKSGRDMGLYYDQIFSHAEICVLTGLSMFAVVFYVFGMDRIYLEQKKSGQYHSQIAVYKMLEEEYRQSERLRHDMKNHVIALSGLFQSKEWEKMGDYLKNMKGSSLETGGDMTGNKVVDALLYQKRRQAEREHVKWECDVQVPKECRINEFDLCVLFGNLLDNALEACERQRCGESRYIGGQFINIQAKTVKKCFLLEVKNSMDRTEPYGDKLTKKENPQGHGIGLLNVSDVVHKYDGVVNLEAENGLFVISILMPLNNPAHDIKRAV